MASAAIARARALPERVERWLLGPQPVAPLAAARITFASVLLVAYAQRAPVLQDLFGPEGIGGRGLYQRVPELAPFHPGILPWLDVLRAIPSPLAVSGLYALLLVALAAFALGYRTRLCGPLAFALQLLFWVRNPLAFAGWAGYLNGPLLYVVLAPSGRCFSLDAWLRGRDGLPPLPATASGWPLRLLQVHVCAMYAFAAWGRLDKPAWLSGQLVEMALTSAASSRLALDWSGLGPLLVVATWGALTLEGLAPFLLWVPRVRRFWAALLVGLHLSLAALLHVEVWAWSAVMIGGLFAFLGAPSSTGFGAGGGTRALRSRQEAFAAPGGIG